MNRLFSQNPYHLQYLYVNHNKFNLVEWRKQFDLFNEVTIKNLNYYNSRGNIPLKPFKSIKELYDKLLFDKRNDVEELKYNPNQYHDEAIYIIDKKILIEEDSFTYIINYGCYDDYQNSLNKEAHSSWIIKYGSNEDENYIDFLIRIYDNYELIINGEYKILQKYK